MSRSTASAIKLPETDEKQVVRCLLLPQKNTTLLLPNTVVTEVTDYTPPEITEHSPDWLLGILSWRGRQIPLITFEVFLGELLTQDEPNQVAVLNNLSGNPDLPFIAISISDIPRLIHVDSSLVAFADGNKEKEEHEVVLARMVVAGEAVLVPNIDFIEERVRQLGIQ